MRCRFEPTTTILISSHSPPSFPSFLDRQFITLTTGAPEKLLRRANRLVAGRPLDASCSAKLANVTELTDGLMVVALEQLEAAVAGGSTVYTLVSGHAPWVAQVSQGGCVRSHARLGPSADANITLSHPRSKSLGVRHAKCVSPAP